ncbi:MAG: hypothetical protein IJW54_01130 [Clostridia bacterium]|nr:hypothetical protein [Clostridia bacterium]
MKKIWILSIKTSLPNICYNADSLSTELFAFEGFEIAKDFFHKKIKEFAFSKNSLFNGNGKIQRFNTYIDEMYEPEDEEDLGGDFLTKNHCIKIQEALCSAFGGDDNDLQIEVGKYDDGMIGVDVSENNIRFFGIYDGPINGYDPVIHTNIFNMTDKKDYFLYINDLFGQDECSCELYIDLKEAELQ